MGLFDFLSKKPENQYFDEGKKFFNDGLASDKLNAVVDTAIATSSNDTFVFSDALSARLKAWVTLGSYTEAVDSFDKAIAIKLDYADAWYYRGLALLKLRRGKDAPDNLKITVNGKKVVLIIREWDSEAIDSFNKAIAIKLDYADAWYYRGGALGNLRRYTEAVDSFDKAIAIKPDYADALFYRGVALHNLGRDSDALASFNKAIAINPNDNEAKKHREISIKITQKK